MKASHSKLNKTQLSTLYEQDFLQWIEATIETLRQGKFTELDLENLLEELESIGKRERRSVRSNLIVIVVHLLKWKYQPEKRTKSWQITLLEHRRCLQEDFNDSPSLKNYYVDIFDSCYQQACKQATLKTDLPSTTFPDTSPFEQEQILDPDFLP